MKKIILLVLSTAAIIIFLSDHLLAQEKRNYNFKDFTSIDVGWGMRLNVTQGSGYSIQVEADKRDFQVLEVEKEGNTLRFSIDKWSYRKKDDIYITIKMPALSGLDLSGGSRANIKMNIASKSFNADLSGGSILKGELTCGRTDFSLSGGSHVELLGKGGDLTAEGSGGSTFSLRDFEVKDVEADLSGGSNVTVTMNGELNSEQSGGSDIVYYGKASIGNTDFSGGSGIRKGN